MLAWNLKLASTEGHPHTAQRHNGRDLHSERCSARSMNEVGTMAVETGLEPEVGVLGIGASEGLL